MARFGGSQSPRSGAGWSRKNDGRTDDELVEFKRTDNRRSITLLLDDLLKLYRHALAESRRPVLIFELGGREWAVLPESEYQGLRRPPSDPAGDLRAARPRLARSRKVQRVTGQPVLLRPPAQQHPGTGGQECLPGNPPGPPRPLPGPGGLSDLRHRQRGAVGSLGRNQRKGATAHRQGTTPDLP